MWQTLSWGPKRAQDNDWLTASELALHLGLSVASIQFLCARLQAYLPSSGKGRERRFPPQAVELLRLVTDDISGRSSASTLQMVLSDRIQREAERDAAAPKQRPRQPAPRDESDNITEVLPDPFPALRRNGTNGQAWVEHGEPRAMPPSAAVNGTDHRLSDGGPALAAALTMPPATDLPAEQVELVPEEAVALVEEHAAGVAPVAAGELVLELGRLLATETNSLQEGLEEVLIQRDVAMLEHLATLRQELREAITLGHERLFVDLHALHGQDPKLQNTLSGLETACRESGTVAAETLRASLNELRGTLSEELGAVREQLPLAELKAELQAELAELRQQLAALEKPRPDLLADEVRGLRKELASLRDDQMERDLRMEVRVNTMVSNLQATMHPWRGWWRALRQLLRRGN